MPTIETRVITLVDVPLVKRLTEQSIVLDSELDLTRDVRGANTALPNMLLSRDLFTLLARGDKQNIMGQFRYRQEESNARIVLVTAADENDDTLLLHLLDGMIREAGRQGAHALIGEIAESSPLFRTMRTAGFAVYAREVIWRHDACEWPADTGDIELTEAQESDDIGVMGLLCSIIPALVQSVAMPQEHMHGLVYRKNGRIEGYVAVSEGKQGVYLLPHLHPDIRTDAANVLLAAINRTSRAHRVPVYVCVRAYQNWLDSALEALDFVPYSEQALMVRHITAGIRHPEFARMGLRGTWETAHSPVPPPASRIVLDDHHRSDE